MRKAFTTTGLLALSLTAPAAIAGHGNHGRVSLEDCLTAASAVKQGDFIKAEYLNVTTGGDPTYEIEVRDDQGTEWELMCSARTGDIYELETEADGADDPAFADAAKISEKEARKIATDRFPGTIEEVEYEIEASGDPSYEIDVVDEGGTEFKLEVDAVSGDIIEVSVEHWEIGEEPAEKP